MNFDYAALERRISYLESAQTASLRFGRVTGVSGGKARVELTDGQNVNSYELSMAILSNFVGLGSWSCLFNDYVIIRKNDFERIFYIPLSNSSFREFRARSGRGGDFVILSKPHIVENFGEFTYEYSCA